MIEQPTEQKERLRPKDVASDAKIASFKTQVVTGESVTQEVDVKPEVHRADVEQSLLGSSQSMVWVILCFSPLSIDCQSFCLTKSSLSHRESFLFVC